MYGSKFLKGLKCLSKKEFNSFDNYLKGLYPRQKVALSIFEHIKKCYPNLKNPKLNKAYVLENILKLEDKRDKRISNELHKLFQWLEEFLAWNALKENSFLKGSILLEVYRDKKNDAFFYKQIELLKNEINEKEASIEKFFHLRNVWHKEYYYTPTHKINKTDFSIEKAFIQLHNYYHLLKLKYHCELRSRQNVLQGRIFDYSKSLESTFDQEKILQEFDLLSRLYNHLFNLITSPSRRDFEVLKNLFCSNQVVRLNGEDQNVLLSDLINYTISLNKAGNPNGPKEAFDIYDYAIKYGIINPGDSISESRFHNIVNTACELQKFDWTESFIQKFTIGLPADWKESATLIAKARISFGKNNFEKTLELLAEAKFKDHSYTLQSKIMQLRCFYELGTTYQRPLKALISSFKIFLNRNKTLNKNTIKSCLNFLNVLELLSKKKDPRQDIKKAIEGFELLVCKSWLEQKIKSYPNLIR